MQHRILLILLLLATVPALAEKPDFPGGKAIDELPGGIKVYQLSDISPKAANHFALDLTKIAGASRQRAEKILGKAESCRQGKYGLSCEYARKNSVVYINGIADWITIGQIEGMPYKPDSLKALGLPVIIPPSFSNEAMMRWEGTILNYRSVAFFDGGDRISYALIHAFTP